MNLNGTNQTIAIGTGTGTIANNSGSGTSTLTINAPGTGGPLIVDSTANPGGKVAVVIAVTNNQTLNTANSYTGGTTVNAGVYLYIATG